VNRLRLQQQQPLGQAGICGFSSDPPQFGMLPFGRVMPAAIPAH
jgi:hypothetical protein